MLAEDMKVSNRQNLTALDSWCIRLVDRYSLVDICVA